MCMQGIYTFIFWGQALQIVRNWKIASELIVRDIDVISSGHTFKRTTSIRVLCLSRA